MSRSRRNDRLTLLLCGLLAAGGAWALKSDKNQPSNVRSDHGDFKSDPNDNSNGTGIYTGHVVITQGSIMITADKAVLHVINNELDTADVTGNPATFQQKPDNGEMMHGTAMEITYNATRNEIVLITDARLTQAVTPTPGAASVTAPGERLMTADRIRYNTDTQHVIAKAGSDEERVHISFPPKTQLSLPQRTRLPRAPSASTQTGPAVVTHPMPAPATTPPPSAATRPGNPS